MHSLNLQIILKNPFGKKFAILDNLYDLCAEAYVLSSRTVAIYKGFEEYGAQAHCVVLDLTTGTASVECLEFDHDAKKYLSNTLRYDECADFRKYSRIDFGKNRFIVFESQPHWEYGRPCPDSIDTEEAYEAYVPSVEEVYTYAYNSGRATATIDNTLKYAIDSLRRELEIEWLSY